MAHARAAKQRLPAGASLCAALMLASDQLVCQELGPSASSVTGIWHGRVGTIGFDLAVAVHLDNDKDGRAIAFCDFVDYRWAGRPRMCG
ncbi:MAG: hypothetical protein VB934_11845 [Polyangiaceae bacterium]